MITMERSDRPYIRKPLRGLDHNHRPALRPDENGARRRATGAPLGLLHKTGIGGDRSDAATPRTGWMGCLPDPAGQKDKGIILSDNP